MANIKLFVCCHKLELVPDHPLLVPIQVGTALTGQHYPGFLHDDEGDNISEKNSSYCELTAQYWAWKQIQADYFGFFHYRRYLYPDISTKTPYRIEKAPSLQLLDKLGFQRFSDYIQQYDLITPIGENMHLSVRDHYAKAAYHHGKDLKLIEQIISDYSPNMVQAMEKYLSDSTIYFGNIYIMSGEIFNAYCDWLFPILAEFDKETYNEKYVGQEKRVDGYLAERMLGIYVTYHRHRLKMLELPKVEFSPGREYYKRRILNAILPPSSKRRSMIKRIFIP